MKELIIGFIVGVILTIIFFKINRQSKIADGQFVINVNDPEKDIYTLKINDVFNINAIRKKEYIILKIVDESLQKHTS